MCLKKANQKQKQKQQQQEMIEQRFCSDFIREKHIRPVWDIQRLKPWDYRQTQSKHI